MKISDITESFDSNVHGKLIKATNNVFSTRAKIGNRDIVFSATSYNPTGDNIWEIEFVEKGIHGSTHGKSGSGNELQVFSFVIESTELLIAKYKPSEIQFTSHKADGNRSSLYTRLVKRIKIPGYHVADIESGIHDDLYRIVRDK